MIKTMKSLGIVLATSALFACGDGGGGNSGGGGNNENTPDGMTKGQWYSRCAAYSSAVSDCAVAAKPNQCIEMKMGTISASMAQIYCDGSTPNFSLMGVK